MNLLDFLTLIQLAAGLNITFVAVDVSQAYPKILLDKVFKIDQMIETAFRKLLSTITGNTITLNNMPSIDINGKNTNTKIEELKRKYEKIRDHIENVRSDILAVANIKCNFRCFSGLSLMMFLFCCTLMFLAPFHNTNIVLLFITTITLVYSIIGWLCNDVKFFCSLKWVIGELIIEAFIIIGVWILSKNCQHIQNFIHPLNDITIIIASLLPFINFILFFLKITKNIRDIRKQINRQRQLLEQVIDPINTEFEQLQAVALLNMTFNQK